MAMRKPWNHKQKPLQHRCAICGKSFLCSSMHEGGTAIVCDACKTGLPRG